MFSSKNLPMMPALCSKLAYYVGIMLDALACLLCLKLCRHNRRMPIQNYKMNPAYRTYLRGRPPALIEHCLNRLQKAKRKFTADSFIMCDDVNGMFTITGESSVHHVDFGMTNDQPSCTCGDWAKSHFPCKHFLHYFYTNLGFITKELCEWCLYMC